MLTSIATNSIVGAGFGTLNAYANGGNLWQGAWDGFRMGVLTGTISGIGGAVQYAVDNKVNILWNGKSNVTKTNNSNIQFGNNANQEYHTFRHTDELGLNRSDVKNSVETNLQLNANNIVPGQPFNQVIIVNEQKIQYTAYKLPNGTINVGRIHGVK